MFTRLRFRSLKSHYVQYSPASAHIRYMLALVFVCVCVLVCMEHMKSIKIRNAAKSSMAKVRNGVGCFAYVRQAQ